MATLRQVLVRRPWWLLGAIAVILLMAATMVLIRSQSSDAPQIQLPSLDKAQPAAQPVQPAPQQNVQENVGATAPVVVEYRVAWGATNISNRSPNTISAIPTEQGLYNGDNHNPPNDLETFTERNAFAFKIMPQAESEGKYPQALVAASRAAEDKKVVFAAIEVMYLDSPSHTHLFLSLNGGNSWCELTKVPPKTPADVGRTSPHTRVQVEGDMIRLYATDSSVGVWWWTTAVKKSDLPCS